MNSVALNTVFGLDIEQLPFYGSRTFYKVLQPAERDRENLFENFNFYICVLTLNRCITNMYRINPVMFSFVLALFKGRMLFIRHQFITKHLQVHLKQW